MTERRSRILFSATFIVWLTAFVAWTADRYVMPFPLDVDRTLRRFIVCLIGALYCWPIYMCLERWRPWSWLTRTAAGVFLVLLASVAYAATNVAVVHVMKPVTGPIGFGECVQIVMGVCWVFALWVMAYFIVTVDDQRREAERRLAEATQAELKARYLTLASQVHPHFLFNTLNAVSGLIIEGNTKRAEEVTVALAGLLRRSLEADLERPVPFAEEMSSVHQYLSIMDARFEGRFDVLEDIPQPLFGAPIPPMVLQPLIENVFQHGVAATTAKVTVRIAARRAQDKLVIRITDDAPSNIERGATAGTGIGQENIRNRLTLQFGNDAQVVCRQLPTGYEALLTLPWQDTADA